MKLFRFLGTETDWIAANDEAEAKQVLIRHYGISADDIAYSYESIDEVEPSTVEIYPDGWGYKNNKAAPPNATALMATLTKPQLVCSTAQ